MSRPSVLVLVSCVGFDGTAPGSILAVGSEASRLIAARWSFKQRTSSGVSAFHAVPGSSFSRLLKTLNAMPRDWSAVNELFRSHYGHLSRSKTRDVVLAFQGGLLRLDRRYLDASARRMAATSRSESSSAARCSGEGETMFTRISLDARFPRSSCEDGRQVRNHCDPTIQGPRGVRSGQPDWGCNRNGRQGGWS